MACLQTSGLGYRYQADPVLRDINLQVPLGSIYGFLGANGSGKTTTLRLILGLLRPQGGEIRIFGKRLDEDRIGILRRVGSMIESPSFYGHLTARENLRALQIVHRCPQRRIDESLALVGLAHTGRKRAGQFSLGMKQRLGIAAALLHEPDFLILDEPTNGLDPNGIAEIRALLRQLNNERGLTILVSSHLLAEIEKIATHVGILDRGKMVFQGPLRELQERQRQAHGIVLRTSDNDSAARLLAAAGIPAQRTDDGLHLPPMSAESVGDLNGLLVHNHIPVFEISILRGDLERIFLDIIEARA